MIVEGSPHRYRRRKLLALGAGSLLAGGAAFHSLAAARLQRVRKRSRALGAEVTLTALHEIRALAEQAIDAAFRELDAIEDVMSLYRPESQICRLNRDGELADPHPHLLNVLNVAKEISAASDGAFDITVQPLWEIFHAAKQLGALPDEGAITAARAKVGWRRVRVGAAKIELAGEGMAITLNGIAQGYAADCVKRVLADAGIEHALIDCGEFNALGCSDEGAPWKVGIQHPRGEDAFVSVAGLSDRCLATSGDYATRFGAAGGDEFRWHHLFDPRTGSSPGDFASVTVVAETAMTADALSTAVFVGRGQRGRKLVKAHPGADALFVLKDGRILATDGFPSNA